MKSWHKNKFTETLQEQGELRKRKSNGEGPSAKRIKILMSPELLWDACVRLVTVHGRPFQLIEDKAFQDIVRPIIEGFEDSISINSHNVLTGIQEKATHMRLETSQLLQGRIFSLKIDACTRIDRSVLGINAQFIERGKIIFRTLAMREILSRHTGAHLKDLTIHVLNEYNLSIKQVNCVTTDNGSNMVLAVKLMSDAANLHSIVSVP